MNDRIKYSVTNESISVLHGSEVVNVKRTSPNFVQLRSALIDERWDDAIAHLRISSSLERWAKGRFSIAGNVISFDGVTLPSDLNSRIVEMATSGQDPQPLFNFWERLQRNPSARSVEQLWRFLNLTGIPLTSDGHFLAYKGIRMDWRDCHSGTIDNHVGQHPTVPRNRVSDDPNTPCHFGLHVGSLEYAASFGQRVVIVKVDPEHVVCVPYDCTSQKMRVCEYEVVGIHGEGHMPSTTIDDLDWSDEVFEAEYVASDEDVAAAVEKHESGFKDPKTFFLNERQEVPAARDRRSKRTRELDAMDASQLFEVNMDELRRYASKSVRIVGAYRISGGKAGLIEAIMKARQ